MNKQGERTYNLVGQDGRGASETASVLGHARSPAKERLRYPFDTRNEDTRNLAVSVLRAYGASVSVVVRSAGGEVVVVRRRKIAASL